MPKVSVLMPVFNGLPFIVEAVASVAGQDLDDWELVVSDNGSTDGTREYLAGLSDPRIRVFVQEENLGIYGGLNFLLSQARADVAKILCADDELVPDCLSEVAVATERFSGPVIKCLKVGELEEYGEGGPLRLHGNLPDYLGPRDSLLAFLTLTNFMGSLSLAICRPAMLLAHGGFDRQLFFAGDYEGWVRFSRIQGFAVHRRELVRVRQHERQATFLLNRRNEALGDFSEVLRRNAPLPCGGTQDNCARALDSQYLPHVLATHGQSVTRGTCVRSSGPLASPSPWNQMVADITTLLLAASAHSTARGFAY